MQIQYLGTRIFKIYTLTILTGTLIDSIGIGIFANHFMIFVAAFFYGGIITSFLCLPNIIALVVGLKMVYSNSKNDQEKKTNLLYLWITISLIPILFLVLVFWSSWGIGGFHNVEDFLSLLLPLPYALASLYFLFKINNNYDEKYPHNFNTNERLNEDILDADL